MKNGFVDRLISILAGLAVTGGLAWGLYLQGRVDRSDAANATQDLANAAQDQKLAVQQTHFEYIKDALARIEGQLQKEGK